MLTSPPLLETPRLILRGHRTDDFEASAAMWAEPAVVRHIQGTPQSAELCWSRLLRYAGHWALMGFGYWVVEAKDDGRFVGEVGLVDYKRDMEPSLDGAPEAGWVVRPAEHGHGFATEAVLRMLAWADESLDHPRTVCIISPANAASLNVATKVGYRPSVIGRYRDAPTQVMGRARRSVPITPAS